MQEVETTQGICSVCFKSVQLIYENGNKSGRLIIGPHHPPLNCGKIEEFRNQTCSGARKLPKTPPVQQAAQQ